MEKPEIKRLPKYASDVTNIDIVDKKFAWMVPEGRINMRKPGGGKVYSYGNSYGFENQKGDYLERYYPNGKWEAYSKTDGEYRLTAQQFNGTDRIYYPNGQMCHEKHQDGTERRWDENGTLREEKLPDGTRREWYNSGILQTEHFPDGTYKTYHENGILWTEKLSDGTYRQYSRKGVLSEETFSDGTLSRWNSDGKLIAHFTKDVDDTKEYLKKLAIHKVAERQAAKNERLRWQAKAQGKTSEGLAVKKLNPLQKPIAIKKVKKELTK